MQHIGKLAHSFLSLHAPTHIALDYDIEGYLTFSDESYPWCIKKSPSSFYVDLTLAGLDIEHICTFISTFAIHELASVTCLRFNGPHKIPTENLAVFTACFPGIETLHTTTTLLDRLGVTSRGNVFRQLKTVIILDLEVNDVIHPVRRARTFVRLVRNRTRFTVRMLNLTHCRTEHVESVLKYTRGGVSLCLYVRWLAYLGEPVETYI